MDAGADTFPRLPGRSGGSADGSRAAVCLRFVRRRPLVFLTIVLAVVSVFFLSFPGIDILVSGHFYRAGLGFSGAEDFDVRLVRKFGNWMTGAALGFSLLAVVAGLMVRPPRWLLKPSEGLYVIAVYVIAPGLIVNAILKNTLGRARPRSLLEFGGSLDFTPVWQFSDQCSRNCSFSSGEAASAAAVMALFFVIPRQDRLPIGLGLAAIAATVSLARIAAGGHFLSDVLVSWIITLSTIVLLRPVFLGARGERIDRNFAQLRSRLRGGAVVTGSAPSPGRNCNGVEAARFSDATGRSDYDKAPAMDAFSTTNPTTSEISATTRRRRFVKVSVVVPAKNEAENLSVLVPEIAAALAGRDHEIVVVDDGSTDDTPGMIETLRGDGMAVRHIRHERSAGQSRAVRTGVLCADGDCIVTIDGDGQNDPAFIPAMVDLLESRDETCGLVAGQRVGRTDSFTKRLSSKAANRLRTAILNDATRDTGCGLKAVPAELFRKLPYFDGWHRYLPALVLREERTIAHLDVKDRQRRFGQSNYGIFDRAARGALDLFGVWWIIRRGRRTPGHVEDVTATKE
ncbi:glycosyltransferase [Jiella mangrovi]|uniref:Glycosyltransferase n=1 Tax=Jiella mangrovi TaxID=2821407 RepID=A0ABS4BL06_9HYPH|nr:glycosyltransferase [Jiella mangrovi]